ncbi:hypothetical protein F5X99DRAFT_411829 [Biscogniauxia marginata]|nr:hypothetical protein F5X99DRAFT_411829 [Biscogniauxia marginata]
MPPPPMHPGGWNPQLPPPRVPVPYPPRPFNEVIDVDYSEECLRNYDIKGPRETPGNTIDELTARKLSEVMAKYNDVLSTVQRNSLRMFLDCVIDSMYRLTFRKMLPPTCTSVKAAIESAHYPDGCMRDTLRVKFDDPMGFQGDERVRHAGQQQLSLLWSLVARSASHKYPNIHVLPTNMTLDVGLNTPFAAIEILKSEYLGQFNLRDCMNSLERAPTGLGYVLPNAYAGANPIKLEEPDPGNYARWNVAIELGDFHPDAQ